jgi:hypothetical protein
MAGTSHETDWDATPRCKHSLFLGGNSEKEAFQFWIVPAASVAQEAPAVDAAQPSRSGCW